MWLVGAILLAVFVLPEAWDLPVVVAGAVAEVGDGYFWYRWSRRRRAAVGAEALPGRLAEVVERCDPVGQVKVDGERWQARVVDGGPVDPGENVRVVSLEGLTLLIERADRAST
jgi:membrane protein implicated in regulation of membrane protease activity